MEISPLLGMMAAGVMSSQATNNNEGGTGAVLENGLGQSTFLKLLVAQLRNQDPLKPMEDREFIAQMAQLNTVEQMTHMNAKLDAFIGLQEATQGSALLGKEVEAKGPNGTVISGLVEKVKFDQGRAVLVIDGKDVLLSDVIAVQASSPAS